MLSVFSFREEAELFLLGGFPEGWVVRKSAARELVSVLFGPCATVKNVALDPLPEMVAGKTVGLACLPRVRFVDLVLALDNPTPRCASADHATEVTRQRADADGAAG